MDKQVRVSDVAEALESFGPPSDTEEVLKAAVKKVVSDLFNREDLSDMAPTELDKVDSTALARQNYVLSQIRVAQFLRRSAPGEAAKAVQAKVAMEFLRLCDKNLLAMLKSGRSKSDRKLHDEVAQLRGEVSKIADYRARNMASQREQPRRKSSNPSADPAA